MFSGDITIFTVSQTTFSVINLKQCLNRVFNVNIYLHAVQLTSSVPLALQGASHN